MGDLIWPILTKDPSQEPDIEITYFDISSIDNESGVVTNPKRVIGSKAPTRARQVVEAGDVLFSTVRPYLRAIAQVPSNENGVASTGFCVLRPAVSISAKYLYFFARSEGFLDGLLPLQRGVSYPAVRDGDVLAQLVPVAPTAEQTRIVEKLEELLSDLDVGVAELKAAQKKLGQYRQSLLKAAVEGRLTTAWRSGRAGSGEPQESGAQLLERILTERRRRWEEKQLAKFREQGRTPPKDWQDKYPEPVKPDRANLPELPDGWVWASVDQIGEVFLGKMLDKEKHLAGTKLPYLRNVSVRWGSIETHDLPEMYFEEDELDRYGLAVGDVLVCEGGEPGRAAVCGKEHEHLKYQKALHRVRFFGLYESDLLLFFLEYIAKSGRLERSFTGSTIKHFTKESFISLPIPLPPTNEQTEIVAQVTSAIQQAQEQDAAIARSLKQSAAQRKNILKAAFSGQLVPQDPDDEPAGVLLERIRENRTSENRTDKSYKTNRSYNSKSKRREL